MRVKVNEVFLNAWSESYVLVFIRTWTFWTWITVRCLNGSSFLMSNYNIHTEIGCVLCSVRLPCGSIFKNDHLIKAETGSTLWHVRIYFRPPDYVCVKTHDIWEENVMRREIKTEHICTLGFWDKREGVTLQRMTLHRLGCILWHSDNFSDDTSYE